MIGQRLSNARRPEPPSILPPKGRELWDDVIEELINANAATTLDVPNLTLMCMHWGFAMAAYEAVQEMGPMDFGSTGQMRRSPLVMEFMDHSKEFRRISEQFGLSTLARTRLALLDVATRATEQEMAIGLGRNPRRTNRPVIEAAKEAKEIEE